MIKNYEEILEEFYDRYEKPVIEPYIMGFSGIDPPLKAGESPKANNRDHESLMGLLGGNFYGHYHLTKKEYEKLQSYLKYPPEILFGQQIVTTAYEQIQPYQIQSKNTRRDER